MPTLQTVEAYVTLKANASKAGLFIMHIHDVTLLRECKRGKMREGAYQCEHSTCKQTYYDLQTSFYMCLCLGVQNANELVKMC